MTKNQWIEITTDLPGPKSRKVLEQDRLYVSPSYSRPYPLVAKEALGMICDGHGREQIPGFFSWNCRVCNRSLPSTDCQSNSRTSRPVDSHVRNRFLLSSTFATGTETGGNHAWRS